MSGSLTWRIVGVLAVLGVPAASQVAVQGWRFPHMGQGFRLLAARPRAEPARRGHRRPHRIPGQGWRRPWTRALPRPSRCDARPTSTSTPIDRSRAVRYGPECGTALTAAV